MDNLLPQPYGVGSSYTKTGVIFMELARIDPGFATAFAV